MAGTATPIFPQLIQNWLARIQNSDASGLISVVAGGTNGSKIESLIVSSTDTSARDINIYMTNGAVDYLLTTISIPINSGNTNAIPPVDILRSGQFPGLARDSNGNPYIYVENGSTLKIAATTTVTTAKIIAALAQGGDY